MIPFGTVGGIQVTFILDTEIMTSFNEPGDSGTTKANVLGKCLAFKLKNTVFLDQYNFLWTLIIFTIIKETKYVSKNNYNNT